MTINDINKKVETDYDFWNTWIGFMEVCSKAPMLTDELKNLLVLGLASNAKEPFVGKQFHNLIQEISTQRNELGKKEYKMPYYTVASYKLKLINLGWLKKGGKIPDAISRIRDAYLKDDVKSISCIFKLCIC